MNVHYKPLTRVEAHFDQLYADGHYQQAITIMQQFLEESDEACNPYGALVAHFSIASCYYCLGQIEQAFDSIIHYERLCEEYGEQHEEFNLWYLKSLIYEQEMHFEKAQNAATECIRLAQALQLTKEIIDCHVMISRLFIHLEQFTEVIQHAELALNLADLHHYEDLFLDCQINCYLALAYSKTNERQKALTIFESLSHNPFIQNKQRERGIYLYTKVLLQSLEKQEVHQILSEAEQIAVSTIDFTMQKFISWQSAILYEQQNNFEQAYKYMKKFGEQTKQIQYHQLNSQINQLDKQHKLTSIERRANIDRLSGTFTRFYLESICDQWLMDARQTKEKICCIVFDVDDFKLINDNYGHLVGDEVIKSIGKACRHTVTEIDTLIGRYGGDEFVIILKNFTQEQLKQKADDLFRALCDRPIRVDEHSLQLTISMGMVCNHSIIARKFTQLFRVADQALYMAKQQGKNQIVSLSNNNCSTLEPPIS